MPTDLFSRIEPYLFQVEKPSRYLDHEYGALFNPDADYRICFVYPDVYEIGQSNQGLAILYRMVNADPTLSAERAYVPWDDMAAVLRGEGIPLFSLESCTPLAEFDALGFTMPYELCATNILEALDLAGVPILAEERGEDCPLVIAGGPCSFEPEPYAAFFDLFSIGEGEYSIPEFCRMHRELKAQGLSRADILHRMAAELEGAYVPSCYEMKDGACRPLYDDVPPVVYKRVVRDFGATPAGDAQIVPFAEATHDHYNVEVLRGCARGCRFCQAGMTYRPVRERSADQIVEAAVCGLACTGYDEVSLTSLSTTDHSCLPEILRRLNRHFEGTGVSISIPSQRVDALGVEMARLVAGSKKGGLTLAPEAGSQRLRDIINKNVTETELMNAITAAFEAGWRRCKLYFMCGLPGETDEDLIAMGELVGRVSETARSCVPVDQRGNVRISVSCALFIPKPDTPFQWCGQVPREEIERRVQVIRDHMPRRGVDFKWHDSDASSVEAALARGGRELSAVIYGAWKRGSRFDAWTDRFSLDNWTAAAEEAGLDLDEIACRTFDLDEPLPWEHISCGVSMAYLKREYQRAQKGETTPDCSFEGCTGCGLCTTLDCENVLAGDHRA